MLSNPQWRAVREDELREAGRWSLGAWRWAMGLRMSADANADADAYANADAYADAYADANADANADAYADADKRSTTRIREDDMKSGLYAVQLWSANVVVLRVGWFRHEAGDDWECHWTTPYRGEYQTKLSDVWAEGPSAARQWTWGPVLESTASRFHFIPLAKLDPEKWAKVCPRPKGWDE